MDISNNNIIISNSTTNIDKLDIKKSTKNNECQELKNLEYKNVLMYGNNLKPHTENKNDVIHIENMLNRETEFNRQDLWTKLDKTDKISKLNAYSKKLSELYELSLDESNKLNNYFIYCLDRKYLSKIKDVEYNRETGIIKNIPNLVFNQETRQFNIKKNDKHVSTLKSLPPKKNKTVKQ